MSRKAMVIGRFHRFVGAFHQTTAVHLLEQNGDRHYEHRHAVDGYHSNQDGSPKLVPIVH